MRIAMMPMTTSSSVRVNPRLRAFPMGRLWAERCLHVSIPENIAPQRNIAFRIRGNLFRQPAAV